MEGAQADMERDGSAAADEEMEMTTTAASSSSSPRSSASSSMTSASSSMSDFPEEAFNDEEGPEDEEAARPPPSNEGARAEETLGPRNRARRLQESVRDIIREHYLCFVLVWILLVLALAIGTFVTFIEMLIVFRRHHDDPCDVPLSIFVWLNVRFKKCKK